MAYRFIFLALLAETFIIYASVLVKTIDFTPIMVGFYRVSLAIPVFFLLALPNKAIFKVKLKDMSLMLLAGTLFGFDLVFFNVAIHHTSIANVNLFGSLVCFILVPISVIFFKERLNKGFIVGALISLIGIVVLIGGGGKISVATPLGDFFAFLSMCCYSFFLALIFSLRKTYNTMVMMFYTSIGSAIVLFCVGSLLEEVSLPKSPKIWVDLAFITLFGQLLGQGFFGYIMGKIPAQVSSLLLLVSPIIAALMGYIFVGEKLGVIEVLGIFIIIYGVYFAKVKKRKTHPKD